MKSTPHFNSDSRDKLMQVIEPTQPKQLLAISESLSVLRSNPLNYSAVSCLNQCERLKQQLKQQKENSMFEKDILLSVDDCFLHASHCCDGKSSLEQTQMSVQLNSRVDQSDL